MSTAALQLERLIEVGRHREAAQLLERLLAATPGDPDLHCLGAELALECRDISRAREHVERALAAAPDHFAARLALFDVQFAERRFADAEATISGLIRERPDQAELLAIYAQLMLMTLHLEKAQALAVEALRLEPRSTRARRVQVLLLTLQGRSEQAGEQLAELVRGDPDGEGIVETLFAVLVTEGRHREALEVGRQLLRLRPTDPQLIDSLAELRAASHWLGWPLYPLRRGGLLSLALFWLGCLLSVTWAIDTESRWGAVVLGFWVLYAAYIWAYAVLLKRWLLRRGL